jgi:hypothetical protein
MMYYMEMLLPRKRRIANGDNNDVEEEYLELGISVLDLQKSVWS